MPKLTPQAAKTYGEIQSNNLKTFREKLMDLFEAHEYVRVINCDSEPIRWQYLPTTSESISVDGGMQKTVTRGDVEVYLLNPGESEVLLGENAYIMIENLYKQIVSKKVLGGVPSAPGVAKSFNFSDPIQQDQWIEKIYLGKEAPSFGHFETQNETDTVTPKVKASGTPAERKLREHLSEQTA